MLEDKKPLAQLNIKYSDKSNRVTIFFRLFLAIPVIIIFLLLSDYSVSIHTGEFYFAMQFGAGFLFLPIMLTIVFRQKYPKWWFDWVYELVKFSNRIAAYTMMLTDKYPSTDEEQDVQINLEYPNAKEDLNRYFPLIKWLLAIPHFLILLTFWVIGFLLSPIVWLTVLIMGKMPEKLFIFLVGFMRYNLRVTAYSVLLITDEYPSFNWQE